ncbi:MAG TPA: endonuclease III, partial [Gammaproteobacteria bacterium]|nr:endonuclease III [Gammaproteobacteria bacterium]
MNVKQRTEIFKRFQAQNPSPITELKYNSEFELL